MSGKRGYLLGIGEIKPCAGCYALIPTDRGLYCDRCAAEQEYADMLVGLKCDTTDSGVITEEATDAVR